MKCAYHPNKEATAQCSQCKKYLCGECSLPDGEKSVICSRCAALKAAQDAVCDIDRQIEEKETGIELEELKKKRKSMIWIISQWLILFICIAVIIIQFPRLISAFKEEKQIRHGSYSTDAKADQCIKNLWLISKMLQEGKLPGNNIVCPVSKKPYIVIRTEDDVVVKVPKPGLYGFKEMRVSKKNPVPTIIK